MTENYSQGKTTVSPDVLVTIARLSGVERTRSQPDGTDTGEVNRLFKRGIGDGVRIAVEENVVSANLSVSSSGSMSTFAR